MANSDGNSNGNSNGNSDGNSNGNSDGNSDGNSNGNSDGNSDGNSGNTLTVNPQIVDAVKESTKYAFGVPAASPDTTPTYNAGEAIAFEKVAQACAYMVQDGTDYQRNILSVNSAAQGKALALMFKDLETGGPTSPSFEGHALIFVLAIVGSFAAGLTGGFIGAEAGKILSDFPPNSS